MRISRITLTNFGSYEGSNSFSFRRGGNRNIIIIGGKNGAGKTTLFTAIRLCLYGYLSMGHKSFNRHYTRAVTKLINNTAKMSRPTEACVTLEFEMNNGHDADGYVLSRSWTLSDSLSEMLEIVKNGRALTADEIADFEKYLLSLIPPELFDLYFFDGERIADFFLNEGGSERIKEAFLTLCGYDTFEIMRKNFKRISMSSERSSPALTDYLQRKDDYNNAAAELKTVRTEIDGLNDELDSCISEINALEKSYSQSGGLSKDEWNGKLARLREEEKKREEWNGLLKKWANDIIPFIMIKPLVSELRAQITRENNGSKYRGFEEIMRSRELSGLFVKPSEKRLFDRILSEAGASFGGDGEPLLGLSFEQSALLLAQVDRILAFDEAEIKKCKQRLKASVSRSAKLREELEHSSVASVQEYMQKKADLFERKSDILGRLMSLEERLTEQQSAVDTAASELAKTQSLLESELKQASINDISAKAIVMLDSLQSTLYLKQIRRVETNFMNEIGTLMRKTGFIDGIEIDDAFNVHIFRTETIKAKTLYGIFSENDTERISGLLGGKAVRELLGYAHADSVEDIDPGLFLKGRRNYKLPVEIDKTSLSNGEKQIFIMALYHSLVQLCSHEIPFVIDTPFARIDTVHRNNISKYFFKKLRGQVFILSTDEEIDASHIRILRDNILTTYLLENSDSKRTTISENEYFEV